VAQSAVLESVTKLLLIDDDEIFRRTTARTLTAHGYVCIEAASGDAARVVLDAEGDIALALCDIRMPGESGIDVLTSLTADFPDLGVVMTTGIDDPRTAELAFDLGAFGYLVKPFDPNELLINLASALRRRDLELRQQSHVRTLEQTIARTRKVQKVVEGIAAGQPGLPSDNEEVIERLSRAVSLRDEETGRHLQRMSRYAVVLGDAINFSGLSQEDLRLATVLHDVGKIGIPDSILLKPGSLSRDEYVAMQRHSHIGYQLLRDSESKLLRTAADIALLHHERWDGSGYPRALRAEEIPVAARIAAVADVFDALTSDRVYRLAMPFDEAMALMMKNDHQFAPGLLDAFFGCVDEITSIRAAHPDQEPAHGRIRVLVVDDHEIFAHSLIRLLGSRSELKVVGTAGTLAEAVNRAMACAPDVILMDFELPDGDGPQATAQVKALTPSVKVVMLTARNDDEAFTRAIAAGCSGFVTKESAVDLLLEAIVAAHAGEAIPPPSGLAPMLRQLEPSHRGLGSDLTARELDILGRMAGGVANKQIAQDLGVRLNTVRNHVQSTLYKLQAHSKLEAVATAVREGIIGYPST
jgi:putative two-component system response regulator